MSVSNSNIDRETRYREQSQISERRIERLTREHAEQMEKLAAAIGERRQQWIETRRELLHLCDLMDANANEHETTSGPLVMRMRETIKRFWE
jgi:phosphoribosylformimino-5-aminoimidazole carboxamide ribonucleotide (ProFAR) isomerase